jgi:hypothetical protein
MTNLPRLSCLGLCALVLAGCGADLDDVESDAEPSPPEPAPLPTTPPERPPSPRNPPDPPPPDVARAGCVQRPSAELTSVDDDDELVEDGWLTPTSIYCQ